MNQMSELKFKVKQFRKTVLNKQDKLTPGENISIDKNNIISSSGGGSNYIKSVSEDFDVSTEGKLILNKSTYVEKDNTKPITSAAVYAELGIIDSTGAEAIEALAECSILIPAYQDGTFYTDANGAIYAL